MVARLAVVEPAGPGGDVQADQHGVAVEVHGFLLSGYLRVHKGTLIAAASFRRAASRLRARTA